MCSDKGLSILVFSFPQTLFNILDTSGFQLKWGFPLRTDVGKWVSPLSRMAATEFSACFIITGESALAFSLYLCYLLKYLYYASYPPNNFPIWTVRLRFWSKIGSAPCIRSSPEEAQPRDQGKDCKERELPNLLGRMEQEGRISPLISSHHRKHQTPTGMHWNKFRGGYFTGKKMDKFLGDEQSRE